MSGSLVRRLLVMLLATSAAALTAYADIEIGERVVESGARDDFSIQVPAGEHDPATFIPVTVLAGQPEGPTVLLVTGVHGYEFAPILAGDRLADEIPIENLKGNVVIVRPAHVSAFENRSPYVNPYDRKNLNRSFPGDASGTQTERIAHALSTQLIPAADFVFDIHSGDGAEWLDAFVGVYGGPLASDYETALGVALATGFPNVVRYSMMTQAQVDTRCSLNRQAVAERLPTVLLEVGENGQRDPADVEMIVSGVFNALRFLGALPATAAAGVTSQRFFDGTQSAPVNHSGVWYPVHSVGRDVTKGEVLGVIKDYTGAVVETVTAPTSGYTIYGLAGPPVKRGESVVTIAKPIATLDVDGRP
ncbi:MAG: succinylglutamate desuccinylase/aspartoacylase family protein [Pseudomonadota bacterium]